MNKAIYLGLQQYNLPTVVVAHLGFMGVNVPLLPPSDTGVFFLQAGSPFNTTAGNKSPSVFAQKFFIN